MNTATKPSWASYESGIEYRGHRIKLKQDFGERFHLIDGMPCAWGYVVTDGDICNVMPAAKWFQTVADAKAATDILLHVGGEGNSDAFWDLWYKYKTRVKALQAEAAGLPVVGPKARTVIDSAREHGAKFQEDTSDDGTVRMWRVLDQENTPLWWAKFDSELDAAKAYCVQHKIYFASGG